MKLIVVKRFMRTSVGGEGGRILWVVRMGKYVCGEQPRIFQHVSPPGVFGLL